MYIYFPTASGLIRIGMDGSGGTKIATIWRAWEICLTIGECVGHCLGYSVVGYFTRYACTWIHPRFVVMVCCSRFTFLCKSLFVLLSVFFWSLYCLSFFWSLYCLSFGHCIVCPSFGHCIVCLLVIVLSVLLLVIVLSVLLLVIVLSVFWSLYCLSFFWSLYCLSLFDLWLLFILLVSSNFSCTILAILLRPLVFLLLNYWTSRSYDFLIIGLPDLMTF